MRRALALAVLAFSLNLAGCEWLERDGAPPEEPEEVNDQPKEPTKKGVTP